MGLCRPGLATVPVRDWDALSSELDILAPFEETIPVSCRVTIQLAGAGEGAFPNRNRSADSASPTEWAAGAKTEFSVEQTISHNLQ